LATNQSRGYWTFARPVITGLSFNQVSNYHRAQALPAFAQSEPAMDLPNIAICLVAGMLLTAYLIAAWQLDHDTQPRDPYDKQHRAP